MALPVLRACYRAPFTCSFTRLFLKERVILNRSVKSRLPPPPAAGVRPYSSDRGGDKQNKKVVVLGIPNPFIWFRTRIYYFLIRVYFDKEFSIEEFSEGAKQAFCHVSRLLSQCRFEALEGLVAEDVSMGAERVQTLVSYVMTHLHLLLHRHRASCWSIPKLLQGNKLYDTCQSVRLVNGTNRCSGRLEVKSDKSWSSVCEGEFDQQVAEVVCRELDCGAPSVLQGALYGEVEAPVGSREFQCRGSESHLLDCKWSDSAISTCSSDKAVGVTCSGRLEVKSDESWSSVCEGEFDQQVAEVVCRELDCGAPSVLQGALYGEVEAPVGSREFQCRGSESHLLECHRSTCSSGRALGLTCSDHDDVRLVGGANHCSGELQLKHHGVWRAVNSKYRNLEAANIICRQLGCGSSVSTGKKLDSSTRNVLWIDLSCVKSTYKTTECLTISWIPQWSYYSLEISCSGNTSRKTNSTKSVRLVNGTNRCSGRLEVKSDKSWSSVCEGEFDQQVAEVVCRELDCGAPSVLQGALYGEVEAPVGSREFQCRGSESHLLDCKWSDSAISTCSSDKAVGVTCSDPSRVRLVGEASRCAGELELNNQREWRPVVDNRDEWDQMLSDNVCTQLDCGSAVSTDVTHHTKYRPVWWLEKSCHQSGSAFWECLKLNSDDSFNRGTEVICSGLLVQPNVSVSPIVGVSGAEQQGYHVLLGSSFTVTCSTEPQYEGGSFHLLFTTSDTAQNYTLPAVNHSAHFLFSAARSAHRGDYTCVYHVYVFSYNFSSESRPLHLIVSASVTDLIIRCVVVLLVLTVSTTILYFHFKVTDTHPA
ncbi:putative scavenger receptor cysteine-rich type 1 protein M130-like isoform 2 [Scophthalmus maximus]|uniref:Putative scavenger receptor cysteine-rich type 1 protein M130-like isoform 2 n=1 Tax=Scophthalmus maximus TaxID=52904 RepID=A0A2U9C923_SCOMX|nr:putative scavenger receptor cysteine-rich type 1 protein M130-like isoform 2 [Scophthalmus maximus]